MTTDFLLSCIECCPSCKEVYVGTEVFIQTPCEFCAMNETIGIEYVKSLDHEDPLDAEKVIPYHHDLAEYLGKTQLAKVINEFLNKKPLVVPSDDLIDDLDFSDYEE